jgi:hypothetical protein
VEQHDEIKFSEIMAAIGTVFSKEISPVLLEIYFDCLKEYSIQDVTFAAKSIIKNRTITGTLPLVSEFIQAIQNRNGSPDERAELAWRLLVRAIENHGYYDSVQFEDGAICETVKALGGWLRITGENPDWLESQIQWRRKEFITLYKNFARQNIEPSKLIGFIEGDNLIKGEDGYIPKVIFIGNNGDIAQIENKTVRSGVPINGIVEKITEKYTQQGDYPF